jgi:hypothetical protein
VHPSILERLRSEDADLLVRMEKLFGVKLAFRADLNYHVENFKIINATSAFGMTRTPSRPRISTLLSSPTAR